MLTDFPKLIFSFFSKRKGVQLESPSQKLQQTLRAGSGKAVQDSSEASTSEEYSEHPTIC